LVDLALWLSPLDGENPSGEDLRNDSRFHELERLVEPQIKIVYDDNGKPASQTIAPIDWAEALSRAEDLRTYGRDLRLLTLLCRALVNEDGLAGLAQGLTLIAQTFDLHWETMHPALRGNAPPREAALRRINALADLQNTESGLLANLRVMTFFAPRGIGQISGRDLEQATLEERIVLQEAASGLNNNEKTALLNAHSQQATRTRTGCAAFADQNPDEMAALIEGAKASVAALESIDKSLNQRIDGNGPTVPELKKFLDRLLNTLERAPRSAAAGAAAQAEPAQGAANGAYTNGAARASDGPASRASLGELPDRISSREDVVKCLDLVVAFYDRTEPSSPIPHLARRVRRMVHMDFVELMEDLAPSGLKEFRLLAGMSDGKKAAQKE
jgi:type VI secretion system protein ImpA